MDKEFKDQWVRALRSGDFKQGRGTLAREWSDGLYYCCLGVACKVLQDTDPDVTSYVTGGGFTYFAYQGNTATSSDLGDSIMERIGLKYDEQEKLIAMNDAAQENFDTIADWIEENL